MSILSRINISKENEKIILLEDYETFDMFLIKEISNIKDNYSDINLFLKMEFYMMKCLKEIIKHAE